MTDADPRARPDVQELYAADPEGFIAARDELAGRLKAEGDAVGAQAVRKLRKPTVSAWAVDRAARAEPALVDGLLAAGDRLAGAQRQALSGKRGTGDLRAATEERRALIRRLTDVAVQALTDAGRPGENARDEIAGTFEAATLDPSVAERVRVGVLDRTVKPSGGLGSVEGFTVLEGGAAAAPPKKPSDAKREAAQAVKAAERAETHADAAADRSRKARAAADQAVRQAEELAAAARAAETEAKRLAAEAKTARTRADRAVRRAES
jgi:hypothetical protein